ncbi:MAG: DUF3300 domain-containing protein [Rhizobiales bacterium]|nr:DUF3300 domain-containing protein [Hyphomicrobiales bacterium]
MASRSIGAALASLLMIGAASFAGAAEDATAAPAPAPAADQALVADAAAEAPADELFTTEELRTLLAPFALYPDALLAQLLPACAYPIDIVQAARWLAKNEAAVKKGDFSGADKQDWDPTVKALVRFPDVVEKLNDDLDTTTDLGDAFVNQPEDVAAVIQDLRAEAQEGGSLKSNQQQTVVVQQQASGQDYIVIQPTDPEVIYVPTYDPATVYYNDSPDWVAGAIGFGAGILVGAAVDNVWDWGRGWVYPPRWPGYPGYRPGGINNGNINIGNDVTIGGGDRTNIGNGNIGNGNTRPWRPDDRYRPGQGSKPGLADKPRPGSPGAKRPGTREAGRQGDLGGRKDISRPSGDRGAGAVQRPAGGAKPAIENRGKGGQAAQRPAAKPAGAKKPSAGNIAAKNPGAKNPGAKKPVAKKAPKPTAFGDARYGGSANFNANRGAASRQSVSRPRPQQQMQRGGGNRGGFSGGGGRGGGGRGGRR